MKFGKIVAVLIVLLCLYGVPRILEGGFSAGTPFAGGGPAEGGTAAAVVGQSPGGETGGLFSPDEPSRGTAEAAPDRIPDYTGQDVIELGSGIPNFTEYDFQNMSGEHYGELDPLGRCGPAWAKLSRDMMPESERGSIGTVRPSGFRTVKYPDLIRYQYLYNRCHLIAYCLTGQNDNERNLITGTDHLNRDLMLPYETSVASYLDGSVRHVLYRVTPLFRGRELVARGVELEACSLEDRGRDLSFHVFLYNVQPGIRIDYRTGESRRE